MSRFVTMTSLLASVLGTVIISFTLPSAALAQLGQPVEITPSEPVKKRRIIKKVEPVPYWVDADQLRVRDNPVAGDVVGMLELGQKLRAYENIENWVRITKPGADEKWVNADFLTNNQVTWASYNSNNRNRRTGLGGPQIAGDVNLERIKVDGDKEGKLYAASLKQTANGNRVVVTWQKFRQGAHYAKYFVSCDASAATRVQIIGEGYNYRNMEFDRRGKDVNVNQDAPELTIDSANVSAKTRKIADYSCEN